MNKLLSSVFISALVLTACSTQPAKPIEDLADPSLEQVSSEKSERVIRETKNVSYSGTVKPLGISIYMEGTHRLSLSDGRFILLESDSIDLNGYVGEIVDALGAIRPTVESDAMIMRVESISLIEDEEDESVELSDEQSSSSVSSESVISGETESTEPSQSPNKEPSAAAVPEESSDEESEVTPDTPPTLEFLESMKDMASEEYSADNWTQEYCTAHIGFCIPIHRNWWYKSFGATSSHYWHLEMNAAPIEQLGEGPLVVNLDGESIEALGIEEGTIRTEGEYVVGYRSWTNGRHFEIRAHHTLTDAVRYITEQLRAEE